MRLSHPIFETCSLPPYRNWLLRRKRTQLGLRLILHHVASSHKRARERKRRMNDQGGCAVPRIASTKIPEGFSFETQFLSSD